MLASSNIDHGWLTAIPESLLDAREAQLEPELAELCFVEANGDPLLALDLACVDRLDKLRK